MPRTLRSWCLPTFALILDIKLPGVRPYNLTDDEKAHNICGICLGTLFATHGKQQQVIRLLPCNHLFHRKCAVKHIVHDEKIIHDGDDPSIQTEDLIEHANGWGNEHGETVWIKYKDVTAMCPLCRSHIAPAENDFDYSMQWTRKEIGFAKKFFWDADVRGSEERLERSGDSAAFARDLRAAKEYAVQQVAGRVDADRFKARLRKIPQGESQRAERGDVKDRIERWLDNVQDGDDGEDK